jgi:rubrerythrin
MAQVGNKFFQSPYTGEIIAIETIKRNKKFQQARRNLSWKCRKCGHVWDGIRRIWREGKKPKNCPKCNGKDIVKVKKRRKIF